MWILPIVGYLGVAVGFGFLTTAIGKFILSSRAWVSGTRLLNSLAMLFFDLCMYVCVNADFVYDVASGLYYLSELVEEHTVMAKRFLTRMIYAIIGIQALLCLVDGFSFKLSVMSILSHLVYLGNMRRFPVVHLSNPLFLISCGMFSFPLSHSQIRTEN